MVSARTRRRRFMRGDVDAGGAEEPHPGAQARKHSFEVREVGVGAAALHHPDGVARQHEGLRFVPLWKIAQRVLAIR